MLLILSTHSTRYMVVVYDIIFQLTAITWIKEFVELSGAPLLPSASGVLAAVLPCLAYADEPRKSILSQT